MQSGFLFVVNDGHPYYYIDYTNIYFDLIPNYRICFSILRKMVNDNINR